MVRRLLHNWVRAKEAGAFDTWIANEDRTAKNLLLGEHLWLIDHDDAIPDWASPDSDTVNKILDSIAEGLSEFDRHKLIRDTRKAAEFYSQLQFDSLRTDVPLSVFDRGPEQMKVLTDFLSARVSYVHQLITARVNPRQLDLLDGAKNAPANGPKSDTETSGI